MNDTLSGHLKLAVRKLRRAPVFTATAVATLSVALGANTAIFSVVHGVLLEPLPHPDPGALVALWHRAPGLGFDILDQSPATYLTYRSDTELLEDVALWDRSSAQVLVGDEPERVPTLMVTDGFLPLLRADAAVGRRFGPRDDAPGAAETVMLSHAFWQRAFGADPGVVGRSLSVNGEPREIIGVLPQGFRFLDEEPAFLFPARFDPAEVIMGNFSYRAIGRLKEGVRVADVAREVERLLPVAVERYPGPVTLTMLEQAQAGALIRPLKEDLVGNVRAVLWVLLGTVGIVLLIACANVANLFLVRAEGRSREVALRTALGAGFRSVAGSFLAESLLLSLLGGVLGLGLAWLGLRLLLAMAPAGLPRLDQIGLDPVVLAFTASISLAAGLLFGVVPLARLGHPDLVTSLKEGGRGASGGRKRRVARNVLVVGQVGLALLLVVGSGLMIRSFQALRRVDPGFEVGNALSFRITIPEATAPGIDPTVALWRQIQAELRAVPGVRSVGSAAAIPLGGSQSNDPIFVEGHEVAQGQLPPIRRFNFVMPGYFDAMGIPLVAGRDLEWADIDLRRPAVVVSENFAREYWDDPRDAVGRRVATLNIGDGDLIWHEILGVVGAVREDGLDQERTSAMYWPFVQADLYGEGSEIRRSMAFVVRSEDAAAPGLLAQLREAVARVTPAVPVAQVRSMRELLDRSLARTSFALTMLGIAAGVALLLGAIGVYGVVSYSVSQRTREIGVRMALGARWEQIRGLILWRGAALALAGVGLGVVAALGVTRLMASLLFGVDPVDPATYASVALLVTAVSTLATWLPARRAASVDPVVALREE